MKKQIVAALMLASAMTANAQVKLPSWLSQVRLSGYALTQYQYSGQENAKANSFNLRLVRAMLDGRIADDFYWRMQVQLNGNTTTNTLSPRLVDLFAEWQKYDFFKVKVGQFKRPFTFENPMNPIDQGFMSYSQPVNKLAGFADRDGMHASNGRDIGVQLQGDFLKVNGRNWLHYQVGVFNGQGINTKDVDQQKDVIGGVWVMPVKGMRLGFFGSEGSYSRKGTWTNEQGAEQKGIRRLPQHRYAISGEYKVDDWTFRSEYVHATGKAFAKTYEKSEDLSNCTVNETLGSKADGVYALVIAPVIKQKVHVKARYDLYRPTADWNRAKTYYEVGADYLFNKNIQINAEYARVNDRSLDKHDYNMVDVEVDFRF